MSRFLTSTGGGSDIFGSRVAPIGMPNPYGDLRAIYPNLSQTNAAASSDILSKLRGELSPDVINQIQDSAARFGITSGMPGSGLQWNKSLRDIGLTSMGAQEEGLKDYNSIIPTISSTQTVRPETQFAVNETNAVNAAAPNPAAAQTYAQQLFDKYLHQLSGGFGAGGGNGTNIDWTRPQSNNGFIPNGVAGSYPRNTWNW